MSVFYERRIEGLGWIRFDIPSNRTRLSTQASIWTVSLNFLRMDVDSTATAIPNAEKWREANCTQNAINTVCLHVISPYRFIVSVYVCLLSARASRIFSWLFSLQNSMLAIWAKTWHTLSGKPITCAERRVRASSHITHMYADEPYQRYPNSCERTASRLTIQLPTQLHFCLSFFAIEFFESANTATFTAYVHSAYYRTTYRLCFTHITVPPTDLLLHFQF